MNVLSRRVRVRSTSIGPVGSLPVLELKETRERLEWVDGQTGSGWPGWTELATVEGARGRELSVLAERTLSGRSGFRVNGRKDRSVERDGESGRD